MSEILKSLLYISSAYSPVIEIVIYMISKLLRAKENSYIC